MSNSIIAENPAPVKPLTIAALCELDSDTLYALGLTDAHIAALDAADFTRIAREATHPFDARFARGAAERATERAAGVTLVDCAAILGYTPAESEGR